MVKPQKPYLIQSNDGLLHVQQWECFFSGYPANSIELVILLRKDLASRITTIREKVNGKIRYFGYSTAKSSDRLYIYVQLKKVVVDIKVDRDRAKKLQSQGFKVTFRHNWQYKAGWLTGWEIPYDGLIKNQVRKAVLDFMCQAFG
jgi:hypothetical protein